MTAYFRSARDVAVMLLGEVWRAWSHIDAPSINRSQP